MKTKLFFAFLLISMIAISSCGKDEPGDLTVTNATINGSNWTDGMTDVDVNAIMAITFSKAVDPQLVVNNSSLGTTGPAIGSTASFSADSTVMTVTPDGSLTSMETYTLLIQAGALAADGGSLIDDYERSFSTQ